MFTIDLIKSRSRRPQFILEIAGGALFCLLGGPLVVGPLLILVALDFVVAVLKQIPRTASAVTAVPNRLQELSRQRTIAVERQVAVEAAAKAAERRKNEEQETKDRNLQVRDDARAEVIRFYLPNAGLLQDTVPESLIRSQLRSRFPDGMLPEQAWATAQEMIGALVPQIAAARERQQVVEAETRKWQEQVGQKRREIRRLEKKIETINQSPAFDSEVSAPEVRALRGDIRTLKEEIDDLEDGLPESES